MIDNVFNSLIIFIFISTELSYECGCIQLMGGNRFIFICISGTVLPIPPVIIILYSPFSKWEENAKKDLLISRDKRR